MRITATTFEELLECLKHEPKLFQNAIRCSTIREAADKKSKDSLKFRVFLHITTIAEQDDGRNYIIELIRECGTDYTDGDGESEGTFIATKLKEELQEFATLHGWRVLPGIVEA